MREIAQTMERPPALVELARLKCPKCGMIVCVSPGLKPQCACGAAMAQAGTVVVPREETE